MLTKQFTRTPMSIAGERSEPFMSFQPQRTQPDWLSNSSKSEWVNSSLLWPFMWVSICHSPYTHWHIATAEGGAVGTGEWITGPLRARGNYFCLDDARDTSEFPQEIFPDLFPLDAFCQATLTSTRGSRTRLKNALDISSTWVHLWRNMLHGDKKKITTVATVDFFFN